MELTRKLHCINLTSFRTWLALFESFRIQLHFCNKFYDFQCTYPNHNINSSGPICIMHSETTITLIKGIQIPELITQFDLLKKWVNHVGNKSSSTFLLTKQSIQSHETNSFSIFRMTSQFYFPKPKYPSLIMGLKNCGRASLLRIRASNTQGWNCVRRTSIYSHPKSVK